MSELKLIVCSPPQEQIRAQSKVLNDRPRNSDGTLVDQTNRRPGVERHMSRNSASEFLFLSNMRV